ncbi:MazG-like family protein [uncultured Anaerococcus sp.]|uniref:MazG-like family protein n=1 Tax=uncultured Anaerococcus sp. TaxID=293428 RepID=UPI0025F8123C|nr:MazG-like family protein [uncultured Anaerococcus sp.]
MRIQELIKLIEQWAIDRGLDKNGTVEGQLIKTAEEVAELIIGISKDDVDMIKDSIGDVFVTLVVGYMLNQPDNKSFLYHCVKYAKHDSTMRPSRKLDLIYFINYSLNELLDGEDYDEFVVANLVECLIDISDWYELDFVDCIESAYKEIADRKGVVKNGSFIKEEDL